MPGKKIISTGQKLERKPVLRTPENLLKNATDCVLDAGIILRYFSKTRSYVQEWLDSNLFLDRQQLQMHCHAVSRTEVFYISCRDVGLEEAKKLLDKVDSLVTSHNETSLMYTAGLVKCAHSIALGDCYSIATAQLLQCPVFFREERELTETIITAIQEKFGVQVMVIKNPGDTR